MPQRPKPAALIRAEKNAGHYSNAEIEAREAAEIKIGDDAFRAPKVVTQDAAAYSKWRDLMKLFKSTGDASTFITSGDTDIIVEYCLAYSEYVGLIDMRKGHAERAEYDTDAAGIMLKFDKAINQKIQVLTTLGDRLFLNPLSKIRSVPRTKPAKTKPGKFDEI